MLIRILLILVAFAAPAFAQMGGRYSPPPRSVVPPKPVVIATPAPEQPVQKPKAKPRARPVKPAEPVAATVVPGDSPAPAEKPVKPEKPVIETPAVEKPAPVSVVKPVPARSGSSYTTKVKAAFTKRWADAAQPHMTEFQPGNVSVVFKLDAGGKVTAFSISENSSNEAFAKFCEQFVRDTAFDPPPAKSLIDGQFEVPFTFWIY